jgi:hypothetical protein
MEDKGKLLYEEDIKERRAQAELNSNHIGMYVCGLAIVLIWIVYIVRLATGISAAWVIGGFFLSLIVTGISLLFMDRFKRMEVARVLPIKVYENGILMPTTMFDRTLWRKPPFVRFNNLGSLALVRIHKPDRKDILMAVTKNKRRYPKWYDPNSEEVKNILEMVHRASPQVHIDILE